MRIKSKAGDLAFKQFAFPDGQRHFKLTELQREFVHCTIESKITNGDELLDILFAKDALTAAGYIVSLDIRYLLGARMDRRIGLREPFSLQVVAQILNGAGFHKIRILDPHSDVALKLLNAEAVLPVRVAAAVLAHYSSEDTVVIAPDKGAIARTEKLVNLATHDPFYVVRCSKTRDPKTGNLSGFEVGDPSSVRDNRCLIVDDICDGGGTFVGLAKELHKAGAASVDLFVTHGIFSKGGKLEGIREIFTTNSYMSVDKVEGPIFLPVEMD